MSYKETSEKVLNFEDFESLIYEIRYYITKLDSQFGKRVPYSYI